MKFVTKIIDGNDKAREEGYGNFRSRIVNMQGAAHKWSGMEGELMPIEAVVDFGRWIAKCECGGAEYVSPDDPVFFCFSCGNFETAGMSRPVIFPKKKDREAIEAALLEREAIAPDDVPPSQQAMYARGMPRSWRPGETTNDLRNEHEKWKGGK